MAEETGGQKSLEMRVAALEDKLAQVNITEAEMRAYQKVSALLASGQAQEMPITGGAEATPALSPIVCVLPRSRTIIPRQIIPRGYCYECTCGPCAQNTGFFSGGGFGGFGM